MGIYIKKKEHSVPVQAVTESSLKSGSEINVPTIKAVLDGLHHPNLLINGDFQINQRGQNEYSISSGYLYTVDMWCVYVNSASENVKVLETENGIKLTSSSKDRALCQKFEPLEIGKKYILIVKVNNTIRKLEFIGGTYIANNQYLSYEISGNFEYITIKQNGVDIEVEYADLFESGIVYPHVKEDYAIALDRCMSCLQIYDPVNLGLFKAWGENRNSMLIGYIGMYKKMINKPTIMIGFNKIYSDSNVNGYDYEKGTFNVITFISNNSIKIMIKKLNSLDVFNRDYEYFTNTEKITLSCEPL